jgi:hypothetical protein
MLLKSVPAMPESIHQCHSREQAPQSSTKKDYVISGVDWPCKGGFVGIEVCEDVCEYRWGLVRRAELSRRFETNPHISIDSFT